MRYAAGAGGRGIGHHGDARSSEQFWNLLFRYIPREFQARIVFEPFGDGGNIPRRAGMIASTNNQLHIRQTLADQLKGFDHRFQAFIGSPLPESQHPMRIAAP